MKKVSVVMPAYNAAQFIESSVRSILAQSYRDFDFYVVDDGSKDDTVKILEELASEDDRLTVIRKENGGVSSALNRGIEAADTKWVVIMHADDIALPNRLETQLAYAQKFPDVVVWGSFAKHINIHDEVLSLSKAGPTSETEFQKLRNAGKAVMVIHPSAMINREIFIKAGGYNSSFDGSEDLELFDRMAEYGAVQTIPEPLLLYRIHASSISMNRFFLMRKFTRYVRSRQRSRLNKERIPSFEEFLKQYAKAPIFTRLRRSLDDMSQFYYRSSGLNFGEGRKIKAAWLFGISVFLNPVYSTSRIWQQMFSRQSRNLL